MMTTLTPAARALGEQPAFPCQDIGHPEWKTGLTKREYLVAQALAGNAVRQYDYPHSEAKAALQAADATLNALAEEQP